MHSFDTIQAFFVIFAPCPLGNNQQKHFSLIVYKVLVSRMFFFMQVIVAIRYIEKMIIGNQKASDTLKIPRFNISRPIITRYHVHHDNYFELRCSDFMVSDAVCFYQPANKISSK